MDKKRHYVVVIKETGKSGLLITEYIGFITPEKVAEFFGLGQYDVEWYEIEERASPDC